MRFSRLIKIMTIEIVPNFFIHIRHITNLSPTVTDSANHLEKHLVWVFSSLDGKVGWQVTNEELLVWVWPDDLKELCINIDLIGLPLSRDFVLLQKTNQFQSACEQKYNIKLTNLFLVVEDLSFCMLGLLEDFPFEVIVSQPLRDVHSTDIQLGLGGNDVDLIDTSQWASINMVWTWRHRAKVTYRGNAFGHIV